MTFSTFELHPDIYSSIEALGYTEPTPIQKLAIPIILEGGDVLARAQTGTGKTAAFTLPMLHRLSQHSHRGSKSPLALVLTPTRELAAQVAKSVSDYGQNLSLRSTVIFGGVGAKPQVNRLRKGVDIVIGTPGRLLDLATQKELDLSCIDILVFDEADRMLDMGFIHDIRKILRLVKKKRQTLFFSATYTKEIKALSDTILRDPKVVEVVSQNSATETVTQSVYFTPKAKKRNLLIHLISSNKWSQVLVFTKTKHGANRLAKDLNKAGIDTAAIHGNKSQGARTRALADFKENKLHVLVATDIAARGLDISELPYVVNFELPHVPEDYVHRIGRTGRAGYEGEAVSLVSQEEVKLLRAIERTMKAKVPVKHHDEFSEELREEYPSSKKGGSKRPNRSRNSNKKKSGYSGNRTRDTESEKSNSSKKRYKGTGGNFSGNRARDTESEKSNSSKKRYKGTGGNYSGNRTRGTESEKSNSSKKRYKGNSRNSSQNSSRSNSQRGQSGEK